MRNLMAIMMAVGFIFSLLNGCDKDLGPADNSAPDPTSIALVDVNALGNGVNPSIAATDDTFAIAYYNETDRVLVSTFGNDGATKRLNVNIPAAAREIAPRIVAGVDNAFLIAVKSIGDGANVFQINEDGTMQYAKLSAITVDHPLATQRTKDEVATLVWEAEQENSASAIRATTLRADGTLTDFRELDRSVGYRTVTGLAMNDQVMVVGVEQADNFSSLASVFVGRATDTDPLARMDIASTIADNAWVYLTQVGRMGDGFLALWTEVRYQTCEGCDLKMPDVNSHVATMDKNGMVTRMVDCASADKIVWNGKYFITATASTQVGKIAIAAWTANGRYLTGVSIQAPEMDLYTRADLAVIGNEIAVTWSEPIHDVRWVRYAHLTLK